MDRPGARHCEKNLSEIGDWFEIIESLEPATRTRFLLASRQYAEALQLIEKAPDLAYLLLISAVEALSQAYEVPPASLEEFDAKAAQLVGQVADVGLQNRLREHLFVGQRRLQARFVAFLMDYGRDEVKSAADSGEHLSNEKLQRHLKQVYRQRSRHLHDGEPFPPYIRDEPQIDEILPSGLARMGGNRRWELDEYLPLPQFFERLVHRSLVEFARRHARVR